MIVETLCEINLYDVWTFMFVKQFLAFFGAFMHFWVLRFESFHLRFESLFQKVSWLKNYLNDSNPSLNDSNSVSSGQNICKWFESPYPNLNLFYRKPKVSKINLKDLNLFFEYSNPFFYFCIKMVHLSKVIVFFSKPIFAPFSKSPQFRYYNAPNPKFFQNPHSYSLHIIISHHNFYQKPKISHESITIKRNQIEIHSSMIFERKEKRPIITRFSDKKTKNGIFKCSTTIQASMFCFI